MTYFLVMDAWNCVVARFDDEKTAVSCARARGGYVVHLKARHRVH